MAIPMDKKTKALPKAKEPEVGSLIPCLLKAGNEQLQVEYRKEEQNKLGILRAGTCGLYDKDSGTSSDKCMRLALVRLNGYSSIASLSDELMMGGGKLNETWWLELLKKSGYKGIIKQEEEVPIKWDFIVDKTKFTVTGRPDVVLCTPEAKPLLGLELKQASSYWTVKSVLSGEPKLTHVIQAAHYSWKLGVPFELWYVSRTNVMGPPSMNQYLNPPKVIEELFVEDRQFGADKCRTVKPIFVGYKVILPTEQGESVFVQQIGPDGQLIGDKKETMVTLTRIEDYYLHIARCSLDDTLPGKPTGLGIFEPYASGKSPCQYCNLKELCEANSDYKNKKVGAKGTLSQFLKDVVKSKIYVK